MKRSLFIHFVSGISIRSDRSVFTYHSQEINLNGMSLLSVWYSAYAVASGLKVLCKMFVVRGGKNCIPDLHYRS